MSLTTTNTKTQNGFVRAVKDCASGTVGGIVQVFVGQPFDTVKVRLQTQPIPKAGEQPRFSGMLDCVQKTIKYEGFTAFYKGTTTPLVGAGACVSIQFLVLEFMKRFFNERNGGKIGSFTNSQLYLSGAAAGIANSVISGPVEHIRTRLQVQITSPQVQITSPQALNAANKTYSGPLDCIKKIYSYYGIKGIYKGQCITMFREFQGYGQYFFIYEFLMQRSMVKENKARHEIQSWKSCLFGAIAGYGMWALMFPVDLIKSKLQTDGFTPDTRQYKSSLDCARKTYAKEGIKGFYQGFSACILRAGPVNAATFVAFELAMRLFDKL
ncbi:315_t:CDS:2 [Diversispora eburnea]|uniref:315_t:CDS:1 n=1 Tax=Diversispora eburnea TaxID=1213867 RepID=A0A9N8WIE3_9GLOM|nr:315_t:CDS:2 [Diversispora eburnea]